MKVKKRNYRKEYDKFQSSKEEKKNRANRNKNRRKLIKGGKVSKGDGMDIHHEGDNLTVESASKNRGRKEKSRLKGSTRK